MADQSLGKTHAEITGGRSALARYQAVMVGDRSWGRLLRYELSAWLGWIPGALGLILRKTFWPYVLGSCGKGVQFGTNVRLIHPHRIHLGDRVVIGDGCILDARTPESDRVITLGDDVMMSHGVMLSAKGGSIAVGARSSFGAYTVVHTSKGNPVTIGADTAIGVGCYINGGGDYNMDRLDVPIWRQGTREIGGATVEDGVWLGAHVTILGGATVGPGSVVGAGSMVKRPIPALAIAVGAPARVVRMRGPAAETPSGTPAAEADGVAASPPATHPASSDPKETATPALTGGAEDRRRQR